MTVHLVGAGPGDPELLTVRAAQIVRDAQVVIADDAALEVVRALLPEAAEVLAPVDESGKALTLAAR